MVCPVLVVTVEVVMFALVALLTLTVEFELAAVLLVSVACWQAAPASATKANTAAAKSPFDSFTRRMKVFSSSKGRVSLDKSVFKGAVSAKRIAQNDEV
jgi:hypothetical protein